MAEQAFTLLPVEDSKKTAITFKELYEGMLEEIEDYKKLGRLDELMEQKIVFNTYDGNGRIVTAYASDLIGWLKDDDVCIVGNLEGVYF